jgi:hypothetical protein
MSDKSICPICKKDFTEALKVLNASFGMHIDVHIREDMQKIWDYCQKYRSSLPKGLQDLLKEREKNIRTVFEFFYPHSLQG